MAVNWELDANLDVMPRPEPVPQPNTPATSLNALGNAQVSIDVVAGNSTDLIYGLYKQITSTTWIPGTSRIGSGVLTFLGLTNEVVYEFAVYAVSAEYVELFSRVSNVVIGRPTSGAVTFVPLSVDVKDLLVLNGVGAFASQDPWSIYVSTMPNSPDNLITIYDEESDVEGRVLGDGEVLEKLACSIRVRGLEYLATIEKVKEINAVMDAQNGFSGQDRNYRTAKRLQNFIPLGRDESEKRFLFVINYAVTVDN